MTELPLLLLPAAMAGMLAFALTPLACGLARQIGALDLPGPRRQHQRPVPRIGGVAVVVSIAIVVGLLWLAPIPGLPAVSTALAGGLLLGAVPVFAVSLWDDLRPLRPVHKLIGQAAGATVAMAFGLRLAPEIHLFGQAIPLGFLAFPLTLLWIVGVANAFNLIDGLDGLSAGLASISAFSVAMLALIFPNGPVAAVSLVIVGTLVGFLPYNIYPARTFLGDSGAATLGFWLACLALPGGATLSTGMAVAVPMLAMSVPIADTVVSITRRVLRRILRQGSGGIFDPDFGHIHHRLIQLGVDHRRAVLLLDGVGLCTAAIGILSLFVTNSNAALLLATLVAAGFIGVGRLGYDEFAVLRRGVMLPLYDIPLVKLGLFRVFVDMALVAAAFYSAAVLKYDDWNVRTERQIFLNHLVLMLPFTIVIFSAFRLYQRSWRFAGIGDVMGVASAVITSGAASFVLGRLFVDEATSSSLFAIHTALLLLFVSSARSSFRILTYSRQRNKPDARRVLVYGAGGGGLIAVRELEVNPVLDFRVVGFIDDDRIKTHRRIGGYQVLGGVADLERLIAVHAIEAVIVASEKIDADRLRAAADVCLRCEIDLVRFSLAVRLVDIMPSAHADARWKASPA
jgi:UDP-GlcNAc:undecaprenyl-phosphate GlcNAc-1-phosphate transferase